ncbi:MAG: hypothetical protein WB586_18210 [Chthoniobacterales bacterium]
MTIAHYVALWGTAISMKRLALLSLLALASCATDYGPQGLAGGFSDYLTAPDEAVVMFHGNGYTSASRVVQMTALALRGGYPRPRLPIFHCHRCD